MDVVACNQMNVLNDYTRLENEWGILPLMTKLFSERERERESIWNSKDRGTDKTYKTIFFSKI